MNASSLIPGAQALLDEYRRVINELIEIIRPLSPKSLTQIVDEKTQDTDCRSIQSILTHVVCSGLGYSVYIENALGHNLSKPTKINCNSSADYIEQLNRMFEYCYTLFHSNPSLLQEENVSSVVINVAWGQRYDVEQLMEHAIVHVMRHRRQIENFMTVQGNIYKTG